MKMHNGKKSHGCKCRNCSAQLVTQGKSADTYCRLCGTPSLNAQNYENTAIPEKVIEFEIDKAKARRLFTKYLSARPLVCGGFMQKVKSGNFSAVYMPVCVTDTEFGTDITTAYGDTHIDTSACNIVTNLSSFADEVLFSLLSPYDFEKQTDYTEEHAEIPYEFFSEETAQERIKEKIDEIKVQAVSEGKKDIPHEGYLKTDSCTHKAVSLNSRYVLVPVWILSCNTKSFSGRIFMNGQSGKIIGNPPPSIARISGIFGAIAAACTLVGEIIYMAVNRL